MEYLGLHLEKYEWVMSKYYCLTNEYKGRVLTTIPVAKIVAGIKVRIWVTSVWKGEPELKGLQRETDGKIF